MSYPLCSKSSIPRKILTSSILPLKTVNNVADQKCTSSPRFFCSRAELYEQVCSRAEALARSISPSMVSLATFFCPSTDRRIYHSCRGGSGVFVDPTLIVTSAHVVGRLFTWYESPSDRVERCSMIYTASIGRTAALTGDGIELRTRPLAVNFSNDVAVLELLDSERASLSHRPLASSPPEKGTRLMAAGLIMLPDKRGSHLFMGNARRGVKSSVGAKAPWPRDDDLEWIEHDWHMNHPGGVVNPPAEVSGSITRNPGAPWFDLEGMVVGISSWEVNDDDPCLSVGFAAPPSSISSMLNYAKTKGPEDPVVTDRWISSHVIDGE